MGCLKICSADLRHVAQLRTPRFVKDGFGGSTNKFVQKGQLFCKVEETTGTEALHRQRKEGRQQITFLTRYRNDFRRDDEIVFECYSHNIIQINDIDRRHRFVEIKTERGHRPIDQIDIVNELYYLTFGGEVIKGFNNEAITEPFNEAVSDNSGVNLQTFSGENIVTSHKDTCGV